ncbi:PKD domain-containing protein [Parabacteroides sp. PF5-9]|uniref:PKD domain-containing protein n=1 Tax=Parabacteroides sp. PF5-9 TaxID=1742404 RepID=UPI0024750A6F|nr:PKD domain-containing protein [Parabacteroides sp. PF5-9]MDH6358697.1 hypothetical protein [Parabacteroides sp. PF5-9]
MQLRRYIHIVFITVTTVFYSQAQKEANNWYFGYGAGLTWNTTQDTVTATGLFGTPNLILKGLPTALTGSSISTLEGCFSLSDSKGELLFYSDGKTVWNKNNVAMPNGTGLTGNDSSTQSGIIIPYPGIPNKYIAVTLGVNLTDNLSYSIIDMTLDGGLGDVVLAEKNIRFVGHSGKTGETVTSVKHANGQDYWIIAPGRGQNPTYMNAWLVTSQGISTTPVVTTLPIYNTSQNVGAYMKISADGKSFAWVTHAYKQLVYGKFDASTGLFSNVKQVGTESNPYGVEFSASGKYVFVTHEGSGRPLYVYDFEDLMSDTETRKVYTMPGGSTGALQLGPDGRMYIALSGNTFLYVIDNPEDFENLRIYQLPNYFLGTGSSLRSGLGLPSFAANWFSVSIDADQSFCVNTSQDFTVILNQSGADEIAYTEWDFGEGGSFLKDTNVSSGTQTHSYTYEKPGMYNITVRSYLADGKEVASETITVKVNPCVLPVNPNIHLYN